MKIFGIILIIILVLGIWIYFSFLRNEGNNPEYSVAAMPKLSDSPLRDKTLIFLGSSVTLGAASGKEAIADMIAHKHGAKVIKEAVNGTTLVDRRSKYGGGESYIARMKKLDRNIKADALIVQLSTNDATIGQPLGQIAAGYDINTFDTGTIIGALEYIMGYAKETWDCPVIMYSGPNFHNDTYTKMNEVAKELQKKWHAGYVDLFDDEKINTIYCTREYIFDAKIRPIHPTKKGYQAWLPYFEKEIIRVLAKEADKA